jgi:hypothetical protein
MRNIKGHTHRQGEWGGGGGKWGGLLDKICTTTPLKSRRTTKVEISVEV